LICRLAACEEPAHWNGERAEQWWRTHLPDVGRVAAGEGASTTATRIYKDEQA